MEGKFYVPPKARVIPRKARALYYQSVLRRDGIKDTSTAK